MTVTFRNVDASPDDPVDTWPYEGLVTVLERGLVADWRPVLAEIRRHPWGRTARRVERYLAYERPHGVAPLFTLAIERARSAAEKRDRRDVAARVLEAIAASGLTAKDFADRVGTSPSRLSTYARGRVTPSAALLIRMEREASDLSRGST